MKVNNVTVASGSVSGSIPLVVGNNTINIVVTAQDLIATKTYTLTVNRAPSSSADLAGLTTSAGAVSPAFSAATTDYTLGTGHATMTVTPTVEEPNATVRVNTAVVTSGPPLGPSRSRRARTSSVSR